MVSKYRRRIREVVGKSIRVKSLFTAIVIKLKPRNGEARFT